MFESLLRGGGRGMPILQTTLLLLLVCLSGSALLARGRSSAREQSSGTADRDNSSTEPDADSVDHITISDLPSELSLPEQQHAYRALLQAEQRTLSYPNLRVLAVYPNSASEQRNQSRETVTLWAEPTLYEIFLWLADLGLVSKLEQAEQQNLADILLQTLRWAGSLAERDRAVQAAQAVKQTAETADATELVRVFIRNYFRPIARSPYPGRGSWLVLRIFLDPYNEADQGVRRLSILYNAHHEDVTQTPVRGPAPLPGALIGALIQRSSVYPQKDGAGHRYAYLIPSVLSAPSSLKSALSANSANSQSSLNQEGSQSARDALPGSPAGIPEPRSLDSRRATLGNSPGDAAEPETAAQLPHYRLSFIEKANLYTRQTLYPQYSVTKSLEILRNYLRDAFPDNDGLVPPAVNELRQRELDPDSYFLVQELIWYYYLLYLPQRCEYFISSQQNRWQLRNSSAQTKDLWRVFIPRIWQVIDAVRLRYSREFDALLPG